MAGDKAYLDATISNLWQTGQLTDGIADRLWSELSGRFRVPAAHETMLAQHREKLFMAIVKNPGDEEGFMKLADAMRDVNMEETKSIFRFAQLVFTPKAAERHFSKRVGMWEDTKVICDFLNEKFALSISSEEVVEKCLASNASLREQLNSTSSNSAIYKR